MDHLSPRKGIKVVHLQFSSTPSGNYTIRQHEAFLEAGIDSYVLSLFSSIYGDPKIQSLGKVGDLKRNINQRVQDVVTKNSNKNYGGFHYSFLGSNVSNHPLVRQADFIYVHWVLGGFLSLKNLDQLASLGKPMIMVMHDMWSITGGCSYSFNCEKFLTHCGNCPVLASNKDNDLSAKQFAKKKRLYQKHNNIFFVTPSSWLFRLAKNAALTKEKPIYHIPNPIDDKLFKPFDKRIAKNILNLDPNSPVIAFGANKITSPYKGWKYLQEALTRYKTRHPNKEISVLIFGSGPDDMLRKSIPFNVKFMGFIKDDYTTNLVYNATDVFVAPSLADNLPTTILESMFCGTAVVGFDVGGIPDMIIHKENGYLARYKDADDLAAGIDFCLTQGLTGWLPQSFKKEQIIQKHLELYDSIKNQDRVLG